MQEVVGLAVVEEMMISSKSQATFAPKLKTFFTHPIILYEIALVEFLERICSILKFHLGFLSLQFLAQTPIFPQPQ